MNDHNLKPAKKGEVRNPKGRPVGSLSLETRIRKLLESKDLPKPILSAIRTQCGGDKTLLDAMLYVGAMQALQGDSNWFSKVVEHGYGKPLARTELSGPEGGDVPLGITVKFDK